MRRRGRRRKTGLLVALGGLVIGVIVGVLVWFQPQKLFIDHRVDEVLPATRAPPATAKGSGQAGLASTPPAPRAPVTLAAGAFRSLGHATSGRAAVLDLGDGRRFLRLDNLRTSNGPDLFVYLSVTPTGGQRDTFDDNFVSLGRLKGNLGNQNYEIAPSVDLRQPERRHLVPPFHLRVRGGAVALTAHGGLLAGSRPGEVIGAFAHAAMDGCRKGPRWSPPTGRVPRQRWRPPWQGPAQANQRARGEFHDGRAL
jgi:Electron transfer DM13